MEYLIVITAFFFSFFGLYALSKNDFVLIRRSISVESIFDRTFIILLFAFIVSRAFYIFDVGHTDYLHLLRFFYFLKYPGFSLLGEFTGIGLALLLAFRETKILLRIYDIFFLSFFPLLFAQIVLAHTAGYFIIIKILLFITTAILYGFLLKFHKNYTVKDGSVTLLVISLVSLITLAMHIFSGVITLVSVAQLTSLILLVVSLILLLVNQKILTKKSR